MAMSAVQSLKAAQRVETQRRELREAGALRSAAEGAVDDNGDDEAALARRPLSHGPRSRPSSSVSLRSASAQLRRQARSSALRREAVMAAAKNREDEEETSTEPRRTMQSIANTQRFEEDWNVSTLAQLKEHFLAKSIDSRLDQRGFVSAFAAQTKHTLFESFLNDLFFKICGAGETTIAWDQFATYMLLEYQKKDDTYRRSKRVPMQLPATAVARATRSRIARLRTNAKDQVVSISESGMLTTWSPNLASTKPVHAVQLDLSVKALSAPVPGANAATSTKPNWITDFTYLASHGRFVASSGERDLWFFDSNSFEPLLVITHLEETPLRLHSFDNPDTRSSTLLVGDHAGCLSAISFPQFCFTARPFKEHASRGKLNREVQRVVLDDIRTKPVLFGGISHLRWAVHNDWVSAVLYCEPLRLVISASNDDATGLVVGEIIRPALHQPKTLELDPDGPSRNFFCQSEGLRRNPNQTVFHINKGVRCLTYSGKANVVITGGLDRVVRLWNPYVNLRPSGTLQGHGAPIEHVCVQDTCDRVFSYASDHELRVWDLSDLQCLVTVSYRRHGITSDVTASYFHDRLACLILSADQHHVISLRAAGRGSRHTTSHDAAVTCATYNERFSHLISGSSDGVIKVWEVATGGAAFEFVASETKDSEEKLSPLTDCVIDTSKRRLFTAQVDGSIHAWNYNNGQLLRCLDKGTNAEVTSLVYLQQGMAKTLVAGGWDRRLHAFRDTPEDDLMVGAATPMRSRWADAEAHDDDILAMAACPPKYVASAAYDGTIFIWNMSSASVTARLRAPVDSQTSGTSRLSRRLTTTAPTVDAMMEEHAILALAFLPTRSIVSCVGNLVAGGCRGRIYLWCAAGMGQLIARFHLAQASDPPANVTALAVSSDDRYLVVGDSAGWLHAYDLGDYGMSPAAPSSSLPHSSPPVSSPAAASSVRMEGIRGMKQPLRRRSAAPPGTPLGSKGVRSSMAMSESTRFAAQSSIAEAELEDWDEDASDRGHSASQPTTHSSRVHDSNRWQSTSAVKSSAAFSSGRHPVPPFDNGPVLMGRWRGHLDAVTALTIVDDKALTPEPRFMSASRDKRMRMWALRGEYIGVFGQDLGWQLHDSEFWQHPNRPPEVVEYEEAEQRRREEEERLQHEMEELGIYEDTSIGTGIGSDDGDSTGSDDDWSADESRTQSGPDFRLFRTTAKNASTRSGKLTSSAQRSSARQRSGNGRVGVAGSASLQRSASSSHGRAGRATHSPGAGTRQLNAAVRQAGRTGASSNLAVSHSAMTSSSRRVSTTSRRGSAYGLLARDDSTSSRRSSIYELRPAPVGVYASTGPLPAESHAHTPQRRPSAATERHLESMRQTPASATLERRSARSAGNWERHLKNVPYRMDDKVYLTLPYHDLGEVSGPEDVSPRPVPSDH